MANRSAPHEACRKRRKGRGDQVDLCVARCAHSPTHACIFDVFTAWVPKPQTRKAQFEHLSAFLTCRRRRLAKVADEQGQRMDLEGFLADVYPPVCSWAACQRSAGETVRAREVAGRPWFLCTAKKVLPWRRGGQPWSSPMYYYYHYHFISLSVPYAVFGHNYRGSAANEKHGLGDGWPRVPQASPCINPGEHR